MMTKEQLMEKYKDEKVLCVANHDLKNLKNLFCRILYYFINSINSYIMIEVLPKPSLVYVSFDSLLKTFD